MRLYKVVYEDINHMSRINWRGTRDGARKRQRELEKEYGRENVDDFEVVDVPTSKEALLVWLNKFNKWEV